MTWTWTLRDPAGTVCGRTRSCAPVPLLRRATRMLFRPGAGLSSNWERCKRAPFRRSLPPSCSAATSPRASGVGRNSDYGEPPRCLTGRRWRDGPRGGTLADYRLPSAPCAFGPTPGKWRYRGVCALPVSPRRCGGSGPKRMCAGDWILTGPEYVCSSRTRNTVVGGG